MPKPQHDKGALGARIMTRDQIFRSFKSEWVLLENPQTGASLDVNGGSVLWHSKNRDEVYRKARELRPRRSAFLYTGKIPKGTAVIL